MHIARRSLAAYHVNSAIRANEFNYIRNMVFFFYIRFISIIFFSFFFFFFCYLEFSKNTPCTSLFDLPTVIIDYINIQVIKKHMSILLWKIPQRLLSGNGELWVFSYIISLTLLQKYVCCKICFMNKCVNRIIAGWGAQTGYPIFEDIQISAEYTVVMWKYGPIGERPLCGKRSVKKMLIIW